MKVNFNSNDIGFASGTFEDMVKIRKKQLPKIEQSINELLADYDGGMIAIVRVVDDENGKAEGHKIFIGGVGHISTQISMGKGLSEASDKIRDTLIDNAQNDPKALMGILKALTTELLNEMDDQKGKK